MKRRKGIRWDYNGDGIYPRERVKGFWKKYWRRWLKRAFSSGVIGNTPDSESGKSRFET